MTIEQVVKYMYPNAAVCRQNDRLVEIKHYGDYGMYGFVTYTIKEIEQRYFYSLKRYW